MTVSMSCRHSSSDIAAVAQVVGGGSEDGHCIDVFIEDELLQRLVGFVAAIGLRQGRAPFRSQVADGFDETIGMFVPVEASAKISAHDADTDFLRGRFSRPRTTRRDRSAG